MSTLLDLSKQWDKDYEYVTSSGTRFPAYIFRKDGIGEYPIGVVIGENPIDDLDEEEEFPEEQIIYVDECGDRNMGSYRKRKLTDQKADYVRVKEPIIYRPYNAKELAKLIGKAATNKDTQVSCLVIEADQESVILGMYGNVTAQQLLGHWTIDDKPCGVVTN